MSLASLPYSPNRGNCRNLKRVYLCGLRIVPGPVKSSNIKPMRLFLFFVPAVLLTSILGTDSNGVESYAIRNTEPELKEMVSVLASDSLEGRETGKPGQRKAAEYIRDHFRKIGLKGPVNNDFFQPLNLYQSQQGETYIKVGSKTFSHGQKVIYYGKADSGGEVELPLVYAGLGREEDFTHRDGRLAPFPRTSRGGVETRSASYRPSARASGVPSLS